MTSFLWQLRREWWESRAAWVAPLATAALIVIASVLGVFHLGNALTDLSTLDLGDKIHLGSTQVGLRDLVTGSLLLVSALFLLVLQITQYAYLVDCLHGERKDRSILFWKSLPVTDRATVFGKLGHALIVMPLATGAAVLVTQVVVMAAISLRLSAAPSLLAILWSPSAWAHAVLIEVTMLVALELWAMPLYAWVLSVSAAAPRSPGLIALLVPIAVALGEGLLLGSKTFLHAFVARLALPPGLFSASNLNWHDEASYADLPAITEDGVRGSFQGALDLHPAQFFANPALWWGLAVAALFVLAAIEVRRRRDPSA